MAFIRIRKIKGRSYRYREERWREGGKVRSRSTYLGVLAAVFGPVPENQKGLAEIERMIEQYPRVNKDDPPNSVLKGEEKTAPEGESGSSAPEGDDVGGVG